MRTGPFLRPIIFRFSAALLLGFAAFGAHAEGDPPARVARLNYSEGNVVFAPAGDVEWTDAEINRPFVRGDKLWTDKGVRSEIQVGSAVVRMDGRTQLEVLTLDDQSAQLSVTQGTLYVRVRSLPEGENFEIDTPNLAYRAAYPGDYRIDVDPQRGVTRVTIHSGTGAVYGDKGQALAMGGGQQITFKGRGLEKVNVQEQPPQDNFDRWAAERNRREDQSVAARYVPRDVVGYQLLDANGEWRQDANYGAVWFPQAVAANWAPYRNGRWEWIAPWGWTWVDDAPWAFVTSHYGRWATIGSRWAWVPGRMGLRPIYAPALVAFVGNGNSPLAIGGKQTVAWFPLAPGEAWQPTYRATALYISSVNANMPPLKEGGYAYQRKPEAVTAIAVDDFQRGKPSKGSWLRVAANALANAQVIAPPAPERGKAMVARTTQPPADIQQVTSSGPTLQQQIEAQKVAQREAEAQRQRAEQERAQREQVAKAEEARALEQARIAEQARRAEQAKAAEQAKRVEQAKTAEQAKLAEQQRIAQQQQQARAQQERIAQQQARAQQERAAQQQRAAEAQRRAEQAKVAEQQRAVEQARAAAEAKRTDQTRREAVTKREQARREQQLAAAKREQLRKVAQAQREAKRELQVKREMQAKRAQESKRLAKKDDEARRVAHAAQVEQARRAAEHDAQVLAVQRAEREAAARKVAEDKERAQREAWQKQQQALAEQFKREQQIYEEQQQRKAQRQRPDLRRTPPPEPELWQRGIPILNPGRTS